MGKLAVVSFGRMSPVTVGHRKLALKLRDIAEERGGEAFLFLSKRYDGRNSSQPEKNSRNPLPYEAKFEFVQDAFQDIVNVAASDKRSLFPLLKELNEKGYTDVVLVGDESFLNMKVEKYNGVEYRFDSIEKVLSGERSEASDDFLETVSATRVRQAVRDNDYDVFARLVATRTKTLEMWHKLREEMGLTS